MNWLITLTVWAAICFVVGWTMAAGRPPWRKP